MKKIITIFFLVIGIVLLTACTKGEGTHEESDNKLQIYTTVYPLQYFTQQIGKDYVNVQTIYPPGADEHTYEPSQKDMIQLAESDLFIYVGLGLEGFVNKAKETLKKEDVSLLAAGENIHLEVENHPEDEVEDDHDHEHADDDHDDHQHGDIDPHAWIDPLYAKEMAEAIKDELITQLPEFKQQLEANYLTLEQELINLNNQFETLIDSAQQKEMIVSHAAYGYWEHRYGLKQISISGLSSSSEPTQKELKKIISEAKEHKLNYIFFEQNVSSKLAEIVQAEMGAEPLMLHNLSVLTDEDIQKNRTYFSIMEDNLKALEIALNN